MGSKSVGTSLHELKNNTHALVQRVYSSDQVQQSLQYANEHPILTLFTTLVVAMGTMPCLVFLFFVSGSLIFTFSGFLVVEGFLLTIACLVLAGVLSGAAFVAILLTLTVSVSWVVLMHGHEMFLMGKAHLQDRFDGRNETVARGGDKGGSAQDKQVQQKEVVEKKEKMPKGA